MLVSFALAAMAGYAVPFVEPYFRRALDAVFSGDFHLAAVEGRVLTLLGMLGISALLTGAMGANTVSLATVLGGGLGYFGPRLYAFYRDPDGSDVADEELWDGNLRDPKESRLVDRSPETRGDPASRDPANPNAADPNTANPDTAGSDAANPDAADSDVSDPDPGDFDAATVRVVSEQMRRADPDGPPRDMKDPGEKTR